MRRRLLLTAALLPLPIVIAAAGMPGCGSEEFENICGWLKDPDNCYTSFQHETGPRCGVGGADDVAPTGFFASRDKLDICFMADGGQVIFDPPLDLETFPLTSLGFTRLDALAAECGSVKFDGQYSYSVTVNSCSDTDTDPEATECSDGTNTDSTVTEVAGGTAAVATPDGRDTYDVTCSDGTTHHFNRLDTGKCTTYAQLLPRAEIESSAGIQPKPDADPSAIDEKFNGFVRFRVYYPPIQQTSGTAEIAAGTAAEVVQYFDCEIPAPSPLCADGIKDGSETDVDCGGSLCAARCGQGQSCTDDTDCSVGPCDPDDESFLKCTN